MRSQIKHLSRNLWLSLLMTASALSALAFDGTGYFNVETPLNLPTGTSSRDYVMRFGDLNGDGFPEIVISEHNGKVFIYRNNGDGTYDTANPTELTTGSSLNYFSVALLDFDDDGLLDVYALISHSSVNTLIWRNKGNLQFDPLYVSGTNGFNAKVEVGDMDGDDRTDLIVTHNVGFNVYRNQSTSTSANFTTLFANGSLGSGDIAIADFNGDGANDFVWADFDSSTHRLYLRNTTSPHTPQFNEATNPFPNSYAMFDVAAQDLDLDGDVDIVFTGPTQTEVWFNNGTGSFTRDQTISLTAPALALGDLNDDSLPDLVLAYDTASMRVWLQDTNHDFSSHSSTSNAASMEHIALGDVDADGDLDMATGSTSNQTKIWFNNDSEVRLTPDFDGDPLTGGAPLSVHFTDFSTVQNTTITQWSWDFESDGIIDSTLQHPTHTYFDAGTYDVTLYVSDGTYTRFLTEEDFVVVLSDPCATDCDIEFLWDEVTGGINRATGNVGINNAIPAYPLDVDGDVNATGYYLNGVALQQGLWSEVTGGINRAGNVGINNTTPGYALDVTGDVNASELRINGAPIVQSPWIEDSVSLSTTKNVGVGTSSVSARLDVDGGNVQINKSKQDINVYIDGVDHDDVLLFDGGRNAIGMGTLPNPAAFLDVAVKPVAVTSNGTHIKLAIIGRLYETDIDSGVTDSGSRIGLNGRGVIEDSNFQGTLSQVVGVLAEGGITSGTGTVTNAMALYVDNYASSGTITNHYGVYQSRNFAKNFFNGDVGIKTTNPQGALDVNGEIYQRGSLLHADYVFQEAYQLLSIEDQGAFMTANQHLPSVPKAEVDAEGKEVLRVGAHRRGMLEELEKAHLYIQQLHGQLKDVQQLNEQLADQETEIQELRRLVERLLEK